MDFHDERLTKLTIDNMDLLTKVKLDEINSDIKQVEDYMNKELCLTFLEKNYKIDEEDITFRYTNRPDNKTLLVIMVSQQDENLATFYKPLKETKAIFRLKCRNALYEFFRYAFEQLRKDK